MPFRHELVGTESVVVETRLDGALVPALDKGVDSINVPADKITMRLLGKSVNIRVFSVCAHNLYAFHCVGRSTEYYALN